MSAYEPKHDSVALENSNDPRLSCLPTKREKISEVLLFFDSTTFWRLGQIGGIFSLFFWRN